MTGFALNNFTQSFWSIEETSLELMKPLALSFIQGNFDLSALSNGKQEVKLPESNEFGAEESKSRVAVLKIHGPIVKHSDWYFVGTDAYSKYIMQMADDSSISKIILDIDTPGGSVGALPQISKAIQYAKTKKKVIAYVGNGMCASAGYHIACQCDEIHAEYKEDRIGSIGVYVSAIDFRGFWEKQGAVIIETYGTESEEKNKPIRDAINGDDNALREEVDRYDAFFMDLVKEQRGEKLNEKALHGGLYFADDALKMGLIDGFKSLEEIINENSASSNSGDASQKDRLMFGAKKSAVAILMKASANERTEEQFEAAINELNAANLNVLVLDDSDQAQALASLISEKGLTSESISAALTAASNFEALESKLREYEGSEAALTQDQCEETIDALVEAAKKEPTAAAQPGTEAEIDNEEPEQLAAHDQEAKELFG